MAQLKLPTKAYTKRVPPPPAARLKNERFVATLHTNLGSIGPDRNKGIRTLRKILLQDISTALVNASRAVHIDETMNGWSELRSNGHLTDKVAILVDRSPNRPIKNVKFAGEIVIISPASVDLMIRAAAFAWEFMLRYSRANQGPESGNSRKGNQYRYAESFEMYVTDPSGAKSKQVKSISQLSKEGTVTQDDSIHIQNYAPYAAKLERGRYPIGTYVAAFKAVRKRFGSQLAVRFDYVKSTDYVMKSPAIPSGQPVLRIGQPGAFASRMPNIKKQIRNAQKRRGQKY